MSKSISKVILSKVSDESSIPAIARTINAAFSSDPLIQWIRPNGVPWAQPDNSAWRWQYRRVQSAMLRGEVFQTPLVHEMATLHPVKQRKQSIPTTEEEIKPSTPEGSLQLEAAGAVVFLFPPKSQLSWSVTRAWRAVKLFVLGALWPTHDKGSEDSRVDQLHKASKISSDALKVQYPAEKLWYLEIIAVHPSLQSRGIGRKVMDWTIEHVGDHPLYLECTREDNIGFYQNFGFRVVEEVELVTDEQKLRYWVMIRPGKEGL